MSTDKRCVDFFMGANTPNGFYSLYRELEQPVDGIRRYLVKGGPGTGKSKLIKRAVEAFSPKDALVERIHCSSDPESLDGAIFHSGNTSIVDSTPPHIIEPTYPGGFETVINLCEYFDEEKLEKRLPGIIELQTAIAACHKKCCKLLKCADILLKDNYYFVESCTNFEKLSAVAARICKKELPKSSGKGKEYRRLLSAVTNLGILTFSDTVTTLCDRVYLIRDEYGVAANGLLQHIRQDALQKGYEIFSCYCPISPEQKLEHILIPGLKLAFVTQSRFGRFDGLTPFKAINFTRFTSIDKLRLKKQYLNFNRKAACELIEAAAGEMERAKMIHDELEKKYTDAVNFKSVDLKTDEVLIKIAKRYEKQ